MPNKDSLTKEQQKAKNAADMWMAAAQKDEIAGDFTSAARKFVWEYLSESMCRSPKMRSRGRLLIANGVSMRPRRPNAKPLKSTSELKNNS